MHLLHKGDVFRVAMVVVTGDVSCPTAFDVARGMAVAIPNGLAPSVDIPCTFDLIGGSCASPQKVFGKGGLAWHRVLSGCWIEVWNDRGTGQFLQGSCDGPWLGDLRREWRGKVFRMVERANLLRFLSKWCGENVVFLW